MKAYNTAEGKREFLEGALDLDTSNFTDAEVISMCCAYRRMTERKPRKEIAGMVIGFAGLSGGAMCLDTHNMFKQEECHVVYFFYGECNKLLYIGRTNNFRQRWRQHLQSDKEMTKIKRVCLHVFDTKPETMFYESQKIVELQPAWNKAGINGKLSKNSFDPVDIVWFDCNLELSQKAIAKILDTMEVYYTEEWFARHTDEELLEEMHRIHLMAIGVLDRPKHFINPHYDNKGLT